MAKPTATLPTSSICFLSSPKALVDSLAFELALSVRSSSIWSFDVRRTLALSFQLEVNRVRVRCAA